MESGKLFSAMTREELLSYCRSLVAEGGVGALAYPAIKAIPTLYFNLYSAGLSQKTLLAELGLSAAYKAHVLTTPRKYGDKKQKRWSWERAVAEVAAAKEARGHVPPAQWFQANGHGSLVQYVYAQGKNWSDVRAAVGDKGGNFVESRNGMRWLSHAEASLSNFLYARGVRHRKGERYADEFAAASESRYAIYDMHLDGSDGSAWDVEVWGDRPNGHNEAKYARTRAAKEKFNAGNPRFIGIHHADCHEEGKLARILFPAIGSIKPFQFDKPTDAEIPSTHWSNADELLAFCAKLASEMPDGKFPTEDWLRKRGRWASREGPAYNTVAVYTKLWIGGARKLRELLGQADKSTKQWGEESALAAYAAFVEEHGITPGQARARFKRHRDPAISEPVAKEAARVASAVAKYAGGARAAEQLRITRGEEEKK